MSTLTPKQSPMPKVTLVCGESYRPEPINWVWPGWLAAGKLQILAGAPGTGKTSIALTWAARVTAGGKWPDGLLAAIGSVLVWSGEDDPADTLAPRLIAAGADMGRIQFITGITDNGSRHPFDPGRDCDLLGAELERIGDVRLLIVDPIVSAVAGDSHKASEVRRGLQPLVDLAAIHRCAVVGITHFAKGTAGRDPTERVIGSQAFGALARLVMVTAKSEPYGDELSRRFLTRAKSNIGPDGGGFAYDLRLDELQDHPTVIASTVVWGEALEGSARQLLSEAEVQGEDLAEQCDISEWLRNVLAAGPLPRDEVEKCAKTAGFAWRTVQRAMRRAGVVSKRAGFAQPATWALRSSSASAPVAPDDVVARVARLAQKKDSINRGGTRIARVTAD